MFAFPHHRAGRPLHRRPGNAASTTTTTKPYFLSQRATPPPLTLRGRDRLAPLVARRSLSDHAKRASLSDQGPGAALQPRSTLFRWSLQCQRLILDGASSTTLRATTYPCSAWRLPLDVPSARGKANGREGKAKAKRLSRVWGPAGTDSFLLLPVCSPSSLTLLLLLRNYSLLALILPGRPDNQTHETISDSRTHAEPATRRVAYRISSNFSRLAGLIHHGWELDTDARP